MFKDIDMVVVGVVCAMAFTAFGFGFFLAVLFIH